MSPEKPSAFVLMPMNPELDQYFADFIKPPLEEVGFRVERADTRFHQ